MASSSSAAYAVGDGTTNDNEKEPVVESLDQIAVEHQWNRLLVHGSQPPPRSKHAALSFGRKIFVTGGTSPQGTLNDVQVFRADELTWESLSPQSPLPNLKLTRGEKHDLQCPSCTGHGLMYWEKQFVLVGCLTGPASKTVTVLSLDLSSRSWSTLSPNGNAPVARTGHTVVQMASVLVLFGGEDRKGKTLNDIHILDMKTLLWLPLETSGPKPSPRRDHSAASYSDRYLWIFGGKSRSTYFNDIYCLDFQKMEWTKGRIKGHSPMARAGHSGVITGKRWYIVGGESRGNEINNWLAFNLESQEWSEIANIRPGSPLANDGISVVKIQKKGKIFLVAFGGHDANLSNRIYALLLPSTTQFGWLTAEMHSDASSPRSTSFDSGHSIQPVSKDSPVNLSPVSVRRRSNASSGDESIFSIHLHSGPLANGVDDAATNFIGDNKGILTNQDPSTPITANDEEAHEGSYNDRQILADDHNSSDLDPSTRNATQEPEISGNLSKRLLEALKLNEDLQNRLVQTHNAKVELEQALSENRAGLKTLDDHYLELLVTKAEGEWKLKESQQKVEDLERKLNSSSQLQEDSDSNSQSTSRGEQSIANTRLVEESEDDTETGASYETQWRLREAENKLLALINSQFLTESKLITATREKRELSEKAATAMQRTKEALTESKALRAENLRMELQLLGMKAQLSDTQEELQSKQVELAKESKRNFEIEVEMHELAQKISGF